jgi:hypothetical protein
MNPTENPTPSIPSASGYILDDFEAADRIAMLMLNRDFGETIQRITSAEKAASPEFQAWLRYKDANGSDIYIGMNPLKPDAVKRTKQEIDAIRYVYIDLDHSGGKALQAIHNSNAVLKARFVLTSSPDKSQVVWKVEGRDAGGSRGFASRTGARIHWRPSSHEVVLGTEHVNLRHSWNSAGCKLALLRRCVGRMRKSSPSMRSARDASRSLRGFRADTSPTGCRFVLWWSITT